jgi:hypothetical protein
MNELILLFLIVAFVGTVLIDYHRNYRKKTTSRGDQHVHPRHE